MPRHVHPEPRSANNMQYIDRISGKEGSLLHGLDQVLEAAHRVVLRHEVQGFLRQRDVREDVDTTA